MPTQTVKFKCGKCGHRTLHTFKLNGLTADAAKAPAHIGSGPSGHYTGDDTMLTDPEMAWQYSEEVNSRWTYTCHKRCGNNVPLRKANVARLLEWARDTGRDTVWLPGDVQRSQKALQR